MVLFIFCIILVSCNREENQLQFKIDDKVVQVIGKPIAESLYLEYISKPVHTKEGKNKELFFFDSITDQESLLLREINNKVYAIHYETDQEVKELNIEVNVNGEIISFDKMEGNSYRRITEDNLIIFNSCDSLIKIIVVRLSEINRSYIF